MATFLTMYFPAFLSGAAEVGDLTDLLGAATEMFTWFITSMGSLVTFIVGHPIILVMFLVLLSGAVVGMFMRIWKSA